MKQDLLRRSASSLGKGPNPSSAKDKKRYFSREGSNVRANIVLTPEHVEDLSKISNLDQVMSKMGDLLSIHNWRHDLYCNIQLSFNFTNYVFALDAGLDSSQISVFCGVMKSLLDQTIERSLSAEESFKYFKDLLISYSYPGPTQGNPADQADASFGPKEMQLVSSFAFSTFFQHFKLIVYCMTQEQQTELLDHSLELILIPSPEPLQEAITYEVYEEQQEKERFEQELLREKREKRLEQERLALINPFEALDSEQIIKITSETVRGMLSDVNDEFENLLIEKKEKFLSASKIYCRK